MPKRDANGRVGPIDDYAQVACATGGGYIYVPEPEALSNQLSWLPRVLDGLWEVPVEVNALDRGDVEGDQAYQLQMNMTLTFDGTSCPYSLSQKGTLQSSDTRTVVFVP